MNKLFNNYTVTIFKPYSDLLTISLVVKKSFFIIFSLLVTFAFSQLPQTNDTNGNNFNATTTGDPSRTIDRFGNSNSAYEFDGNDYFYTSNLMANQFTNTFLLLSLFIIFSFLIRSTTLISPLKIPTISILDPPLKASTF